MEKNPNHREAGTPYLDRIIFLQTSNPLVGVLRLMTKELDFVAALAPLDVRPLEGRAGIKLARSPGNRWMAMQMRIDRPPFDYVKLRQAIADALDRKRIVDIVMAGKADIAEGPTPPGLWWFNPALKGYPHDPEQAKALLAEAAVGPDLELEKAASTSRFLLLQIQVADLQAFDRELGRPGDEAAQDLDRRWAVAQRQRVGQRAHGLN